LENLDAEIEHMKRLANKLMTIFDEIRILNFGNYYYLGSIENQLGERLFLRGVSIVKLDHKKSLEESCDHYANALNVFRQISKSEIRKKIDVRYQKKSIFKEIWSLCGLYCVEKYTNTNFPPIDVFLRPYIVSADSGKDFRTSFLERYGELKNVSFKWLKKWNHGVAPSKKLFVVFVQEKIVILGELLCLIFDDLDIHLEYFKIILQISLLGNSLKKNEKILYSIMKKIFDLIDLDGNGTLSFEEINVMLEILNNIGYDGFTKQYKSESDLIKEFDTNGDGQLDFNEFQNLFNLLIKKQ